jgi:hypothetical protein
MSATLGIVSSSIATETWLRLPGGAVSNSIASTPDHAAFALGNFTVQWWGTLDDTTVTDQALISQWAPNSSRAFSLRWANISGVKQFKVWVSLNGTSSLSAADGAFPFTLANDQFFGVKAARNSTTGLVRVWTSPSIVNQVWTLRGSATPASSTGALFNSTKRLMIGGLGTAIDDITTSNHAVGYCCYAGMMNGDDAGSWVAGADFRTQDPEASSFTDGLTRVWTINGAADMVTLLKAA